MDAQDSSVGEQRTKCVRQPGPAGVEVAHAGVVAGKVVANKKVPRGWSLCCVQPAKWVFPSHRERSCSVSSCGFNGIHNQVSSWSFQQRFRDSRSHAFCHHSCRPSGKKTFPGELKKKPRCMLLFCPTPGVSCDDFRG